MICDCLWGEALTDFLFECAFVTGVLIFTALVELMAHEFLFNKVRVAFSSRSLLVH